MADYRYYKFYVTATRTASNYVQFDELIFGYNNTRVDYTGAVATNPVGGVVPDQLPSRAIDNSLTTKFLDVNGVPSTFIIDFQTAKLVNSYTYATGGDAIGRDPKSWTLYGSNDNTTWVTLDTQTNFAPSTTRDYQLPWITIQPPVNALVTDPIIIGEPINSRFMQLLMMD